MAKRIDVLRILTAIGAVGSQVGMEIVLALQDKKLDGPEVGRIVKRAIQGLRMAGVSQRDLDQVLFITDPFEFEALEFKEGDMLIYSPAEVNNQLQIDLD